MVETIRFALVDLPFAEVTFDSCHHCPSTRTAVAAKLTKGLRDAQQGTPIPDERQTVGVYLDAWLLHKQSRLRPRAWATYEQAVRLHLAPGLAKIPLARLSPAHVDAWFQTHQASGASARTIRYARTVFRVALQQALKWSLVAVNAAALVEPPRHRAKEIQPLNPDQAKALIETARTRPLGGLVSVALALGLRLGGALGLRWTDIDFDAGTLSVRQALERSGGDAAKRRPLIRARHALRVRLSASAPRSDERRSVLAELVELRKQWRTVRTTLHFTELKSARSRRTIMLPGVVTVALKAQRVRQLEDRLAAGGSWADSGLVFTTPIGTPVDPRNATRLFHALLVAADLPSVRFHDLRHTAATLLLAQGVDARTIMETLGHSQISLTMNTYTHVLPAVQREAAVRMDAILKP